MVGLGRKPAGKRMKRKLSALGRAPHRCMLEDPIATSAWLGKVLNGWVSCYAVPASYRYLSSFRRGLKQRWARVLRRRSQKGRIDWQTLDRQCSLLWPTTRRRHPWSG